MAAGFWTHVVNRLGRMTLRQRSVLFAVVAAGCASGAGLVTSSNATRLSPLGTVLCASAMAAVAASDYAFRVRKRLQFLPMERDALSAQSRDAVERSRSWMWFVAGLAALWNAVDLPPTASAVLNLSVLTSCAAGCALLSFGFWRAATPGRQKRRRPTSNS